MIQVNEVPLLHDGLEAMFMPWPTSWVPSIEGRTPVELPIVVEDVIQHRNTLGLANLCGGFGTNDWYWDFSSAPDAIVVTA